MALCEQDDLYSCVSGHFVIESDYSLCLLVLRLRLLPRLSIPQHVVSYDEPA